MSRNRLSNRTIAVFGAACLGVVAVVATATGALAEDTAATAPAAGATAAHTCEFPVQKLKVAITLTLRSSTDNDLTKIKVRATSKSETGSFYRKSVTLRSLKITTKQGDGDAIGVATYNRTASPATISLDPKTTGAEVDEVAAVTRFRMADGGTATATCRVSISD